MTLWFALLCTMGAIDIFIDLSRIACRKVLSAENWSKSETIATQERDLLLNLESAELAAFARDHDFSRPLPLRAANSYGQVLVGKACRSRDLHRFEQHEINRLHNRRIAVYGQLKESYNKAVLSLSSPSASGLRQLKALSIVVAFVAIYAYSRWPPQPHAFRWQRGVCVRAIACPR